MTKYCLAVPVCTLSPICSSNIFTDFPFSRITSLDDGKHPPPPPPDGGGDAGVVVVESDFES